MARRAERLRELASDLEARYKITVHVVVADLATPEGLGAVRDALATRPVQTAVLNAGFGSRGAIGSLDRGREVQMVRLNVEAVVDLACEVLGPMRAVGAGRLVIVSSAAAWQPLPYMATYAASKAFELSFAEAIFEEVRGTGIRVTAACPGPTRTEFSTAAGSPGAFAKLPHESAEGVVAATWRALDRGRPFVATGGLARLTVGCARVLPRRLVVWAAGRAQRGAMPR